MPPHVSDHTPLPSPDHDKASEPEQLPHERPHLRQLALQFAAAFVVLSLAWPYCIIRNEALPWPNTAFAIGAVALLLSSLTRQTWWWRLIHTAFAPGAAAVTALDIAPGWFLLAFMLLLLVYRGAIGGQIPLFLSNQATAAALTKLTGQDQGLRFIDLGAGIGSIVCTLAGSHPQMQADGIENAPATWLIGYLRTRGLANCNWRWGDLWRTDLEHYDVVYAFLSPAPMPELWAKAQREMKPGALFVSNSFPVPELDAESIIDVDDERQTRLYCYRINVQD